MHTPLVAFTFTYTSYQAPLARSSLVADIEDNIDLVPSRQQRFSFYILFVICLELQTGSHDSTLRKAARKRLPRRHCRSFSSVDDAILIHGLFDSAYLVRESTLCLQCFHRCRHGEFHAGPLSIPSLLVDILGFDYRTGLQALQYGHDRSKVLRWHPHFVVRFGPYYAYCAVARAIIGPASQRN